MNVHLKKLTYRAYIVSAVLLMAVIFGIWLFSNSFLSITISPRDAVAFVDGKEVNVNILGRAQKRLSIGKHSVRIESDGYISSILNLDFKRGITNRKKVVLNKIPSSTTISEGGRFLAEGVNDEIFYLGNDGSTIYRSTTPLNDKGEIDPVRTAVTASNLSGIEDITWSPKKDLALFKKSDGIYLFDFKKYNFVDQTETLWGNDIGSIAWAPDNSKIAYYYAPEQTLIFSNLDNSSKERILNLSDYNIQNPILRFSPNSEWLAVIPRNSDTDSNSIYLMNIYSRAINKINDAGKKLDAIFSPDSNKIFYASSLKARKPAFGNGLMSRDGSLDVPLSLHAGLGTFSFINEGNILAAGVDETNQNESIFKFDVNEDQLEDFSLAIPENESIISLISLNDNKVAAYETSSGIYGIRISF